MTTRRRPMQRRDPPQMELFNSPAQPRRSRETRALYDLISFIRRAGRRVYRVGRLHSVNGNLLNTRELQALA